MAPPAPHTLLETFAQRSKAPEAFSRELDRLLECDDLDGVLTRIQRDQPEAVFTAIHDAALEHAGLYVGLVAGQMRDGMLVAFPVMFREGHPPMLDAAFWDRLTGFAQVQLGNPSVQLAPLLGMVQPTTLPGFRLGGWQAMLRDAVHHAESSEALDLLQDLETAKQEAYQPVDARSDQVVALTQRMQIGVLTYQPDLGLSVPIHRLARAVLANRGDWREVVGPLPDFSGMGVPQPIRLAFTQALQQHLELSLTIARQHRGLGRNSELAWDAITSDDFAVTFVPRSGPHLLDPIRVAHTWLRVVGNAGVAHALESLMQAGPAVVLDAPTPVRRRLN